MTSICLNWLILLLSLSLLRLLLLLLPCWLTFDHAVRGRKKGKDILSSRPPVFFWLETIWKVFLCVRAMSNSIPILWARKCKNRVILMSQFLNIFYVMRRKSSTRIKKTYGINSKEKKVTTAIVKIPCSSFSCLIVEMLTGGERIYLITS